MNKLFNKIRNTMLLGIVATSMCVNAQTVAIGTDMVATNTDSIISQAAVLTKLTLWTTNTTTPSIVRLYDGYRLQTNTAYTNYTVARTAEVRTWITSTGTTNNHTNWVYKTTANPVAAATVVNTPTATITVPTGGELLTITDDISLARRLSISNSAPGLNYIFEYRNP
jgi:hypothetical protein